MICYAPSKAIVNEGNVLFTCVCFISTITIIRIDPLSKLCSVWGVNVTNDNYEVRSFTGLNGCDARHVTELQFRNYTLEYIPYGIGRKFTALTFFVVGSEEKNMGLKRLQRANFENMESLYHLIVTNNNIEIVDEDSLRDLPNLITFFMSFNKLKRLERYTFENNAKLLIFFVNSNQLEYLHRDLFKNNPLLEAISLRNNHLKLIHVDFTSLRSLKALDLHANVCIDKCTEDFNNNMTEFQSFINQQCSPRRR